MNQVVKQIANKQYLYPLIHKHYSTQPENLQPNQANKTYHMPQKKTVTYFKPEFPPRLRNNRIPLFLNKQRLWAPYAISAYLTVPFCTILYLIKYNPWYLTFPAALPLMIAAEIIILLRWVSHKKHNKYIVERVYLYENNVVEFVFANKIRRHLKNTQPSQYFLDIQSLVSPKEVEADGQVGYFRKGFQFPQQIQYETTPEGTIKALNPEKPNIFFYGWTKFVANYENYIFPKYYEYANWEILIPILNGQPMDFTGQEEVANEEISILPTIQNQLKWIEEDQKYYKELALKHANEKSKENQSS